MPHIKGHSFASAPLLLHLFSVCWIMKNDTWAVKLRAKYFMNFNNWYFTEPIDKIESLMFEKRQMNSIKTFIGVINIFPSKKFSEELKVPWTQGSHIFFLSTYILWQYIIQRKFHHHLYNHSKTTFSYTIDNLMKNDKVIKSNPTKYPQSVWPK